MKITATLSLIVALSASSLALAHPAGAEDMKMKDMGSKKCMDMADMDKNGMGMGMNGMDMQSMDMQKCKDMMNEKSSKQQSNDKQSVVHKADAVVKKVDAVNGKVMLSHEPVKSLNWPAMTMGFVVKDKALFDKLGAGKKVSVDFVQQGSDYVVTAVK